MRKERIWTKNFNLNFAANGLCALSLYMVNTTISTYMNGLGVAAALTGFVVSIYSIGSVITRPIAGPMVNRLDRRKLMAVAFGVIALGFLGIGLSRNLYVILLGRLLQGLGYGVSVTAGSLVAVDCTPASRMGEGLGFFGLSQMVTQAVASPLALFLREKIGYQKMMLCCLLFFFLAVLAALSIDQRTETEPAPKGKLVLTELISPKAWLPATVALLFAMTNGVVVSYAINCGNEIGIQNVGIFFTAESIAMFLIRFIAGKYTDLNSMRFMISCCGAALGSAMVLLGVGRSFGTYLLAAVLFGAGYATAVPVNQSTAIKSCPADQKGTGMGTYLLGTDAGVALGGMIGGALAGRIGYARMFLFFLLPILLGVLLPHLCARRGSGDRQPESN